MQKTYTYFIIGLLSSLLLACSSKEDTGNDKNSGGNGDKKELKATLVTVTTVKNQAVETTETAIGSLEGLISPTVAAELAARVVKMYVNAGQVVKQGELLATLDATDFGMQRSEQQAEVARIQALIDNQGKIVERNQKLVDKKFISQNVVDNDVAQQNVLKQQLAAAKARAGSINHNSSKSKIFAPVNGVIEKRLVGAGDFVRVGDPIVQIVSKQKLRAHLPFPEHIGSKLKPGLKVRLITPTSEQPVESVIHELKPMITEGSRTVDVIADINNVANWQPGASVTGTVILGEQSAAMMIPEQSLVLRPAGEVAYVVRNNVAYQAVVKTGLRQNGLIEVLEGLQANDVIVVDGAGFLTDKADVSVQQAK
jgi:membrane fusion protein, multidrug efflux system